MLSGLTEEISFAYTSVDESAFTDIKFCVYIESAFTDLCKLIFVFCFLMGIYPLIVEIDRILLCSVVIFGLYRHLMGFYPLIFFERHLGQHTYCC